ncbi:unnamed protein product, partial [Prunus brigantina]
PKPSAHPSISSPPFPTDSSPLLFSHSLSLSPIRPPLGNRPLLLPLHSQTPPPLHPPCAPPSILVQHLRADGKS